MDRSSGSVAVAIGKNATHRRAQGLASVTFSRIPPSTPSSFILTSFQLLDNILPRNAGFTGVRDVVCFSLYIGLNKQEDERRRY